MALLRKMVFVLAVVFLTAVLWVGSSIYFSYTSTELRGELLGSENVYDFLGKGMLDEVKVTLQEGQGASVDGLTVDLLEPIDPYFSRVALEKITEKIEEQLIVPPEEFHNLQNDAVIRSTEIVEELEQED